MRVVVLTQVAEVLGLYGAIAAALGHEVPAALVARPAGDARAYVDAAGERTDVVFVRSKRSLAPLLRAYEADVGLCTGFPWLVPQEALDAPRLGIVNGHPTLLPHGRGPHPWAWAVRNAETEIGLTYHFMDASFDTGNVLAQKAVPLDPEETEETLLPKMVAATHELLPEVFAKLEAGEVGTPQEGGDYQHPFEPDYALVDPARTAAEVHRQVRAWSFVPARHRRGPLLERDGTTVRLVRTSLGEVAGAECLQCADGPLWILETAPS